MFSVTVESVQCLCGILQQSTSSSLQQSVDVLVGSCGSPTFEPEVSSRIVGGTEAREHSWPWQCRLITCWGSSCFGCGATIIDENHVLTAAHCV